MTAYGRYCELSGKIRSRIQKSSGSPTCQALIHTILGKNQLRWSGHVSRTDDYRLPKCLFYGELSAGKRSVGGQYEHYKDTLKVTMKNFHIDPDNWEQAAQDRPTWRSLIHKGGTVFENNRIANAEKKRELRKQRQNSDIPLEDSNFACPTCGRQFRARIGLFSHIRIHRVPTMNYLMLWSSSPWMDELYRSYTIWVAKR